MDACLISVLVTPEKEGMEATCTSSGEFPLILSNLMQHALLQLVLQQWLDALVSRHLSIWAALRSCDAEVIIYLVLLVITHLILSIQTMASPLASQLSVSLLVFLSLLKPETLAEIICEMG